jgi:hypothetical protein
MTMLSGHTHTRRSQSVIACRMFDLRCAMLGKQWKAAVAVPVLLAPAAGLQAPVPSAVSINAWWLEVAIDSNKYLITPLGLR